MWVGTFITMDTRLVILTRGSWVLLAILDGWVCWAWLERWLLTLSSPGLKPPLSLTPLSCNGEAPLLFHLLDRIVIFSHTFSFNYYKSPDLADKAQ